MLNIISWNINSIRTRINQLIDIIYSKNPDIILLQEIKCQNENFPYDIIGDLGYNIAIKGQKSYNGVAILSKYPIEEINYDLPNDPDIDQSRYIEALISIKTKIIRILSVYVPNGQELESPKFQYKIKFFDALYNHLKDLLDYDEEFIIGGDFNVSPEDIDVYDSKLLENTIGCSLSERKKFRSLLNLGLTDAFRVCNPDSQEFSWWDYRGGAFEKNLGLRIDHFLLSSKTLDLLENSYIDHQSRGLKKSSDHAPINCILDIK